MRVIAVLGVVMALGLVLALGWGLSRAPDGGTHVGLALIGVGFYRRN